MIVRASSLVWSSLVVLGLVAALALPARAAPLRNGFGGAAGYGTNSLPPNDDGSSSAIDLTAAFPGGVRFFGGTYTTAYVNTNGNVTFAGPLSTYTPRGFPIASQPMIAPYWGDVDIRGPGFPSQNGVWWVVRPGQFIVTWSNVGYYSIHDDKKMDFQMILTNSIDCGLGDFDVEFRYNRCEWETGDASGGTGGFGGTPAQAGFDAGNLTDYVAIMGSLMPGIARALCTGSNIGESGVWRFGIRNGTIMCPGTGEVCDTGMPGICGVGVTQCSRSGVDCISVGVPASERCDGIDNDCNGMTDEGMLCTAPEVCSNGRCVPPCFEGGCSEGLSCDASGACIDAACVGVTCGPLERCERGACIGACDSIVCPRGLVCIAGRCVDTCSVVTCDDGELCVDGRCVPTCPCRACDSDEICGADGSCTPLGCDIVTCEEGFYCEGGACHDACAGAVCPMGEMCERGLCVPSPVGPGTDAGVVPRPDGGIPGVDAGIPAGDAGRGRGRVRPSGGCGCEVAGAERRDGAAWAVLGLLGVALLRRRRRR